MIQMGVIGYGYWGPNLVRNFNSNSEIDVIRVSDLKEERLKLAKENCPNIDVNSDPDGILNDEKIEIVAIATPVFTHYEIAKKVLENGKNIFVEKPFTSSVKQAGELVEIAEKKGLTIMVDHTFLFTGAVRKIKQLVESNTLGNLYYYDSVRVNLGLFQHDINVIWDLAPHDISIMDYILDGKHPSSISAVGAGHFGRGLEDVAYLSLRFDNDFISHFHINWLSPVKIRKTLIAGDKKMLVWNDLEADEKIKIYDTGVEIKTVEGIYNLLVDYRVGEMHSPIVERIEALKLETQYLVNCIKNNEKPINDGEAGLRIVKVLEASDISLKNDGKTIKL